MNSMYQESYVEPILGERATKADIQNKLIQLRSSNILMGTNPNDYNSIFMEDYVVFARTQINRGMDAFKRSPPAYDLKATHYKIGLDKTTYESSHKADYDWKDPDIANGQNTALAKDLRGKPVVF